MWVVWKAEGRGDGSGGWGGRGGKNGWVVRENAENSAKFNVSTKYLIVNHFALRSESKHTRG